MRMLKGDSIRSISIRSEQGESVQQAEGITYQSNTNENGTTNNIDNSNDDNDDNKRDGNSNNNSNDNEGEHSDSEDSLEPAQPVFLRDMKKQSNEAETEMEKASSIISFTMKSNDSIQQNDAGNEGDQVCAADSSAKAKANVFMDASSTRSVSMRSIFRSNDTILRDVNEDVDSDSEDDLPPAEPVFFKDMVKKDSNYGLERGYSIRSFTLKSTDSMFMAKSDVNLKDSFRSLSLQEDKMNENEQLNKEQQQYQQHIVSNNAENDEHF